MLLGLFVLVLRFTYKICWQTFVMEHTNCTIKREKLREASDALYYEVSMLRVTAITFASDIFGENVSPILNAVLESFAVHVRVLIDFFYSENPRKDDIIAEHFFLTPNRWQGIRPPKSETLVKAKTRANKLLAHLTYTRLKENLDKRWPVAEIMKDIENVLDFFLQNVPKELLGSRWEPNRESEGK